MDDFDQYCSWARKPNDFIEHYQARTLGSYEILDRTDEETEYSDVYNLIEDEHKSLLEVNETYLEPESMLCRIRSFRRTQKGVINQGDTVKSHSQLSLNLPTRSKSFTKGENPFRFEYNQKSPISSPDDNNLTDVLVAEGENDERKSARTFEIYVVGKNGVGKTTLCEQFLTSETCAFRSPLDCSSKMVRQVTVDLDDREWNLLLHDFDVPTTLEAFEKPPDAYIMVYSIEDKYSFDWCTQILQDLSESFLTSAIFIVATKSDLERLRQVSSEKGKRLASIYDAEFFEVSTVLNHMIDNLLVQIITKIRRHKKKLNKAKFSKSKYSMKHKRSSPGNLFMNFFRRLSRAF